MDNPVREPTHDAAVGTPWPHGGLIRTLKGLIDSTTTPGARVLPGGFVNFMPALFV